MGCDNCRRLEREVDEMESELDLAHVSLRNSHVERYRLGRQIARLADFILRVDCGYPLANENYPNGMGAVDAAIEYMKELREKIKHYETMGPE